YHGLAFADRQIRNHAVEWRLIGRFLEHIGSSRQSGAILGDVAFSRILLGLGLRNPRLSLRQTRFSRFPSSFPAVVLRLGDQGFFVQTLSAVPVQFDAVGIRLSAVQVGNRRFQGRLCRKRIGPRSLNRSSRRRHIGRGLHVLQLGKQSPSLDSVAFFYVKLHDLS